MNFKNGEAEGIPRGIQRDARPAGLFQWDSQVAYAALGLSDDFFAVFPSQFTSVKLLFSEPKRKNIISERLQEYLGRDLYRIFIEVLEKFNLEKLEIYVRNVRKVSGIDTDKRKVRVDLPRVVVDILRVQKKNIDDDYPVCQAVGAYIYEKYKVLAREMKRYYFDIKYDTIYKIYRDCCPNPCKVFFVFNNENIWGEKNAWYISTVGRNFKNIKTKNF